MKKFICALLASVVLFACALGGCGLFSRNGRDGIDGQDLNIYDIYEKTNEERKKAGLEQLDFFEFLKEYLHYDFEYSEDDMQAVINRSLLSSVNIYTRFNHFSSDYYAGSGVIVDINKSAGDAYIVTNAHVVLDVSATAKTPIEIIVYLYGNEFTDMELENVKLVSYSISYDIALLKVTGSNILKNSDARAAVFAESENVYVGEKVYTVGNPGGMGLSATTGIISKESELIAVDFAEDTGAENVYRVMRTDAASNGGNSGGALYDSSGRIVGIVNAKDADPYNENIGYALCGSYVKRLWKLMKDSYTGSVKSGVRCAVFPAQYTYTSKAYFDSNTNLTEIRDEITVLLSYGNLKSGDKIKHIKIFYGSGDDETVVEDIDITRYYNLDDVMLSARNGYKITYTVERNGDTIEVNADPVFENFV